VLLSEAAQMAAELSTPSGTPVLVNRDAHLGNVLAAARAPWLLADPKPLVGDAAFDAGSPIDWLFDDQPTPAQAERIVTTVASALAIDEQRARAWAVVRAMDNYRWALFDEGDDPTPYLATAAALTAIA
jgi:streptomycin 6-kinase